MRKKRTIVLVTEHRLEMVTQLATHKIHVANGTAQIDQWDSTLADDFYELINVGKYSTAIRN